MGSYARHVSEGTALLVNAEQAPADQSTVGRLPVSLCITRLHVSFACINISRVTAAVKLSSTTQTFDSIKLHQQTIISQFSTT